MRYFLAQVGIVLVVWAFPAILLMWPVFIAPDSWFVTIEKLHIDDAEEGTVPAAIFERRINRHFTATWHGVIRRVAVTGRYNISCFSDGEGVYDVDTQPPEHLTLNWFTYPNKCMLSPGTYYVRSVWTLHLALGSRDIGTDSNVFTIFAKK